MTFDFKARVHRRFNPLTREWILVSPQRTQRPWQGQFETTTVSNEPEYDPNCYMCPGNVRAAGIRNSDYSGTFVFENDYPALLPEPMNEEKVNEEEVGEGLFQVSGETGICRVVCFSPKHNLTIARMPLPGLRRVVDAWVEQYSELSANPSLNYVQIFENRGTMMGASNPHPHGQIWASSSVPDLAAKEQAAQREYFAAHQSCLLCEYLRKETQRKERLVMENAGFSVVVPFWAVWPFETIVLAKRHLGAFPELSEAERDSLATMLKQLTTCYDNLFKTSFPYSMGFHQSSSDGNTHPEWHFHAHFYPPLLRSATVRKFMVGYEMLARAQRDITPEDAAARLRDADKS